MRPQQNRRMRGRGGSNNNGNNNNNNQNRKGPNPLTRSYESNGPDVKIRGSAQQIAEKYTTLARDAQSSGDRVMAENYLQHAEHYNRIIMAAMAQMPQPPVRDMRDDEEGDDEGDEGFAPAVQQAQPSEQQAQPQQNQQQPRRPRREYQQRDGSGPQPVIEGTPAEVALTDAVSVESTASQPQPEISEEAPVVDQNVAPVEDAEEAPVRKPRRPRRPRLKSADDAAGEEQAAGDEAVTEAAQ